ncbi:MAG TPA: 5-oxoprolinase subunit PxpB [Pyrinomonadaceae bacterium]|nr:5-oxoprolinase subunit PxpB [Pyrinomonadaceae bacterium]
MNSANPENSMNITPLGDNALTVTFGNVISPELNDLVLAADAVINNSPFNGLIETVPAYSSISVFYDTRKIKARMDKSSSSFEIAKANIQSSLAGLVKVENKETEVIEIPISFAPEDAPDLELLADESGLTTAEQVIEIFLAQTYRVFMLGFLPGFSYLGEVDERIAMARKESPRTLVPRGSIGIAGRQTGIYSLDSPGGWQIIGRTEMEMFLPGEDPPTRLQAGDQVRFIRF